MSVATVVPVDDYSPIFVGDTANPFSILVLQKNGFKSILGATISMTMQSVTTPATIKICAGPWNIDPLDNGRASYTFQPGDVDTADSWKMWVKILIGGKPLHVDDGAGNPKILVIKPLPIGV